LVGGVVGFFVWWRFEVVVAVDDEMPVASRSVQCVVVLVFIEDLLVLADVGDGVVLVSMFVIVLVMMELVVFSVTQCPVG